MFALISTRRSRHVLAAFALTLAPLASLAEIHIGVTYRMMPSVATQKCVSASRWLQSCVCQSRGTR